eukprot:2117889-Alexandrium_andersonii.AAC.1
MAFAATIADRDYAGSRCTATPSPPRPPAAGSSQRRNHCSARFRRTWEGARSRTSYWGIDGATRMCGT